MDTFIDKLAQKRNAQEMIRANMTAEAEKLEQLQSQMHVYDVLMQEIRQVNLKTAENAVQVQDTLKECMEKLAAMQEAEEEQETAQKTAGEEMLVEIRQLLEEQIRQSDDFIHKENVKVYRNVQAAVVEELHKQTEELESHQMKNRGSRALLPISILILLGVTADIIIHLFSITITF